MVGCDVSSMTSDHALSIDFNGSLLGCIVQTISRQTGVQTRRQEDAGNSFLFFSPRNVQATEPLSDLIHAPY